MLEMFEHINKKEIGLVMVNYLVGIALFIENPLLGVAMIVVGIATFKLSLSIIEDGKLWRLRALACVPTLLAGLFVDPWWLVQVPLNFFAANVALKMYSNGIKAYGSRQRVLTLPVQVI